MATPVAQQATVAADQLRSDGVAVVRNLLAAQEIPALLAAVADGRTRPGRHHRQLSRDGDPVMDSDLFRWHDTAEINELVRDERLVRLAGEFFETTEAILLEDQWFFSSAGASTPSPWHQDEPYHPLDRPFLTVWIPLTPVPGPVGLRAVTGSHLADVYAPVEFSATQATLGVAGYSLDPAPEVDAMPDKYSVLAPDVEPGDAILLDSRTLHAAGGFCAAEFVRLSIRYAHPATAFTIRPWAVASFWDDHLVSAGAPLSSLDAFPMLGPA